MALVNQLYIVTCHTPEIDKFKFVKGQRSRSFLLKFVIFSIKANHYEHLHDQNNISASISGSCKSTVHCYISYMKY